MGKRRLLVSIIGLMAFIMMLGGVSYAYFIYNDDVVDVSLETGGMQVTYTSGNTMNLDGAIPMNDNLGKINPYYIDFSITGRTDTEDIYYEIILVPKDGNTINPRYVKTYLTDQSNNNQHGVCPYDLMQNSSYKNGKVIYSDIFLHNTNESVKNTTKNFRLRVWLDETYNEQASKTFAFDVYVYAKNVKVNLMNTFPTAITDEKVNIKEIYFNSESQDVIDSKYDAATIKADLTYNICGSVKAWLVPDTQDNTKYIMYVESDGETYFNTGTSLFNGYTNLKKIEFNNVNTSKMYVMNSMFAYCKNLEQLDLSSFDTNLVNSMWRTFIGCENLTSLILNSFDTSNVTDMLGIFDTVKSLANLDVSSFNTSNVRGMQGAFKDCDAVTVLNISNLDVNNVTDMGSLFRDNNNLSSIIFGEKFNTKSATTMANMFYGCVNLTNLDLTLFDTSNVTNMGYMFNGCSNLTNVNLSSFNTSKVISMYAMFAGCNSLTTLDVSSFNTKSVSNTFGMFNCNSIVTIYVSEGFVLSSLSNETDMFRGCSKIVGEKGTTFINASSTYARIDDPDNDLPGYFTYKEAPI